mmetsp:Transcript_92107/g.197365  ORF Transcript_92107/g.197365 Transcript_92107/m.197365 type:complete len:699 (+) Transcript_92107:107-2203(+)
MPFTTATSSWRGRALSRTVALATLPVAFAAEAPAGTIVDQVGLLQVSSDVSAQVMVSPTTAMTSEPIVWSGSWDNWDSYSEYLQPVKDSAVRAIALSEGHAKLVRHEPPAEDEAGSGRPTSMKRVDRALTTSMAGVLLVFLIWSCADFHRSYVLYCKHQSGLAAERKAEEVAEAHGEEPKIWRSDSKMGGSSIFASSNASINSGKVEGGAAAEQMLEPWPIWAIVGLTLYRFYTGFLSATWLPYLLAMEGAELWSDNQALFMAVSKLIYGLSILFTPIFGIFGDRMAEMSLAVGRRFFIKAGVIVASIGIFLCHWSAPRGHFFLFLIGVLVWRVGEGLNDVTTEAICPEVLPKTQFELSSSIKAVQFLVGGVAGYGMLAGVSNWHYSWLYQAYLILMFVTCIPPLFLIAKDEPKTHARRFGQRRRSTLNMKSLAEAYVRPGRYTGGFPRATLCIFLFSFGAAPPFFLLLMLRDLVGMEDYAQLQRHFSLISIVFFLAAAVASALNALTAPKRRQRSATDDEEVAYTEEMAQRSRRSFNITAFSVLFFGLVCFVMPFTHFGNSFRQRLQIFYVLAALLGTSFGSVYARFQDCQWQLLPKGVEIANAMGYSTTWKLLGAGLGNFVAGLILDLFADHSKSVEGGTDGRTTNLIAYHVSGYHTVCTVSAVLVWASGAFVLTLQGQVEEGKKSEAAARSLKTS